MASIGVRAPSWAMPVPNVIVDGAPAHMRRPRNAFDNPGAGVSPDAYLATTRAQEYRALA